MERATLQRQNLSKVEVAVLGRYAIWHPEIEDDNICDPCSHCNPSILSAKTKSCDPCSHCTPCGSCGRE